MTNEYGLNVSYFKNLIMRVHRDIKQYTPDEFAREMARMARTASPDVLHEKEFKQSNN